VTKDEAELQADVLRADIRATEQHAENQQRRALDSQGNLQRPPPLSVARGLAPQTSSLCGGIIGLVNMNALKPVNALPAATRRGDGDIVALPASAWSIFLCGRPSEQIHAIEYAVSDESPRDCSERGERLFNADKFSAVLSQEGGAEIARVASGKNRIGRNDNLHAAFCIPPVPARIIKGCSGVGIRSISLPGADIKVLRPNTQHHPALVLEKSILPALDCDNSADLSVGAQPIFDRFFGLCLVRRFTPRRIVRNGPFARHSARRIASDFYAGRRPRLFAFGFSSLLQSYRRVLHQLPKDLEATRFSQLWRSILPVS
jgi:hypothetical protein